MCDLKCDDVACEKIHEDTLNCSFENDEDVLCSKKRTSDDTHFSSLFDDYEHWGKKFKAAHERRMHTDAQYMEMVKNVGRGDLLPNNKCDESQKQKSNNTFDLDDCDDDVYDKIYKDISDYSILGDVQCNQQVIHRDQPITSEDAIFAELEHDQAIKKRTYCAELKKWQKSFIDYGIKKATNPNDDTLEHVKQRVYAEKLVVDLLEMTWLEANVEFKIYKKSM